MKSSCIIITVEDRQMVRRPIHHHFMFPVFFFLIQLRFRVTDDVFRKVADIDCAVDILQQQNRPGPQARPSLPPDKGAACGKIFKHA